MAARENRRPLKVIIIKYNKKYNKTVVVVAVVVVVVTEAGCRPFLFLNGSSGNSTNSNISQNSNALLQPHYEHHNYALRRSCRVTKGNQIPSSVIPHDRRNSSPFEKLLGVLKGKSKCSRGTVGSAFREFSTVSLPSSFYS